MAAIRKFTRREMPDLDWASIPRLEVLTNLEQVCACTQSRLVCRIEHAPGVCTAAHCGCYAAQVEMPRLYKSVDAFVLPSRGEGWGRPHVEAMSMGLPVIGEWPWVVCVGMCSARLPVATQPRNGAARRSTCDPITAILSAMIVCSPYRREHSRWDCVFRSTSAAQAWIKRWCAYCRATSWLNPVWSTCVSSCAT